MKEILIEHKFMDMIGKKYGKLTVLRLFRWRERKNIYCECLCDCGRKSFSSRTNLINGIAKSCGCNRAEAAKRNFTSHGKTNSREYKSWQHMLDRCRNTNCSSFHNYGGRGIKVCRRWQKFINFFNDMGECPDGYEIERIDNDKGYYPNNCKWATIQEQNLNKRTTRYITAFGETLPLSQMAIKHKIPFKRLWKRIELGWTPEDAIMVPPK